MVINALGISALHSWHLVYMHTEHGCTEEIRNKKIGKVLFLCGCTRDAAIVIVPAHVLQNTGMC